MSKNKVKVGIFATHPIQYFVPVWRALAQSGNVVPKVYFFSDHCLRDGLDPEFGRGVTWDVPLLDGYESEFLRRDADLDHPWSIALPAAPEILARDRLDVVLVHGYTRKFEHQVLEAARRAGKGTVLRGEFTDASESGRRPLVKRILRDTLLRRLYRKVDALCYLGRQGQEHLARLGVPPEKMHRAPYSVDTDFLERQRKANSREACRRELGLPEGAFAVLFSGKLIPRKRPLEFLEAAGRLRPEDGVYALVLGDGPLRAEVESAARRHLGDRFRAPGFVNQQGLGRYFAAADAFVLPSSFDTWGLVVNEAMQFGLPVIVSDRVGCAPDLVLEGETGFTYKSGDVPALADRLGRLARDTGLRQRLGEGARRRVADFSCAASVDGILKAVRAAARRSAEPGDPG